MNLSWNLRTPYQTCYALESGTICYSRPRWLFRFSHGSQQVSSSMPKTSSHCQESPGHQHTPLSLTPIRAKRDSHRPTPSGHVLHTPECSPSAPDLSDSAFWVPCPGLAFLYQVNPNFCRLAPRLPTSDYVWPWPTVAWEMMAELPTPLTSESSLISEGWLCQDPFYHISWETDPKRDLQGARVWCLLKNRIWIGQKWNHENWKERNFMKMLQVDNIILS